MKNNKSIVIGLMVVLFTLLSLIGHGFSSTESIPVNSYSSGLLKPEKEKEIDDYVIRQLKAGLVPGVSVAIVKDGFPVYLKGFGYADVKAKIPVTPKTLFEIGSNSKAITALGVLQLENSGRLRLGDPIKKYLPWFKVKYHGKDTDITLEQFLHHTSGIPFKTISYIPVSEDDNALEATVKKLINVELNSLPGTRFSYATINYDVLGLVIEKVSGESYEEYMTKNILASLGMHNTYLFRKDALSHELAKGYKIGFSKALEFSAPIFRGNTPAGYYISNAEDMAKWLSIQLGAEVNGNLDNGIIERSHVPGTGATVGLKGPAYACGWYIIQNENGIIWHSGNNPNYSSSMVIDKINNLGIVVLANLDSTFVVDSARGILTVMKDASANNTGSDLYKNIDEIAVKAIYILTPLLLLVITLLFTVIIQINTHKRSYIGHERKGLLVICVFGLFSIAYIFFIYILPRLLFLGLSWGFLYVWCPISLILVSVEVFCLIYLVMAYFLVKYFFSKKKMEKMGFRMNK